MQQPAPRRKATFPLWFYLCLCGLIPLALVFQDLKTGEITGRYPLISLGIKEREAEGQQLAGEVNRLQMAHGLEHGKFATTPQALSPSLPLEGRYYHYQILPQTDPQLTLVTADPVPRFQGDDFKHYRGAVKLLTTPSGKRETIAILCFQTRARHSWLYGAPQLPGLPFYSLEDRQLHCGEGSFDRSR